MKVAAHPHLAAGAQQAQEGPLAAPQLELGALACTHLSDGLSCPVCKQYRRIFEEVRARTLARRQQRRGAKRHG